MSFDLKLENGDLRISNNGDLRLVRDNEKLRQDCLKILITPIGGNKINSWYGCDVARSMVGEIFDKNFSIDVATQQVQSSLENLQILQKTQIRIQNLTAAESIAAIKEVYVNTNPLDQRVLELKASVLTRALSFVDVSFHIKLY